MVQTRNAAKRQKTEECTSCMKSVLFNSDSLFRIACYLPADDLLNLALTCRRFGIGGDDGLSFVDETARRVVHDAATNEEMAALPCYDGNNELCKYNYLQSLRAPLTFDQLVRSIEYVEGNKSRVTNHGTPSVFGTAFSNNIMMAGKHYASFEVRDGFGLLLGVMRPGKAMQSAKGSPRYSHFCNHFSQRRESRQYNNSVNCCMYSSSDGDCYSSDWGDGGFDRDRWDGMEAGLSPPFKIGLLLDLDEGTLSVYTNDRRLGVMKRGLAGHYCWVVSLPVDSQVTIKR